jgi:hypothetical protein
MSIWCENPAHTAALRPLTGTAPCGDDRTDPAACLYPHEPAPQAPAPRIAPGTAS